MIDYHKEYDSTVSYLGVPIPRGPNTEAGVRQFVCCYFGQHSSCGEDAETCYLWVGAFYRHGCADVGDGVLPIGLFVLRVPQASASSQDLPWACGLEHAPK